MAAKIKEERTENVLGYLSNNISNCLLLRFPHEMFPGPNCAAVVDNEFELRAGLDYKISIPYPIYVSNHYPEALDICAKRVKESFDYNLKLKRYKSFYKTSLEKKKYKTFQNKNVYHYIVFKYAELLERNPDPYFAGNYDWYFTGGNLENLNDRYILHATGQYLETLAISKFDDESKSSNLHQIASQTPLDLLDETSAILEIRANRLDSSNKFMLRRKNSISVLRYEENSIESEFHSTSEDIPYISLEFGASSNELVTSDLLKSVKLWDVNSLKPKQILFKTDENLPIDKNWNCIQKYDSDVYAFTELQKFALLDSRVSNKTVKYSFFSLDKAYDACENISSMVVSKFNNLIYFGTTHKILGVDPRFMAASSVNKNYIVQQWVHQMELSPSIIKSYVSNNTEYVLACSQINGDIRVIENHLKSPPDNCSKPFQEFSSYSLPIKPPSTSDALVSVRCRGNCLNPLANFQKRLKAHHTGICFVKRLNQLLFVTANSNSDMFAQAFLHEEKEQSYNKKLTAMWVKMEKTLLSKISSMKECLIVTAVEQMKGMGNVSRCKVLSTINAERAYAGLEGTKRPRRWQRPMQQLKKCQDVLATDMLHVWDVDLNKSGITSSMRMQSIEAGDGESKVSQWLDQQAADTSEIPMTQIGNDTFMDTSNALNATLGSISQTSMKKGEKLKFARKKVHVKGF